MKPRLIIVTKEKQEFNYIVSQLSFTTKSFVEIKYVNIESLYMLNGIDHTRTAIIVGRGIHDEDVPERYRDELKIREDYAKQRYKR